MKKLNIFFIVLVLILCTNTMIAQVKNEKNVSELIKKLQPWDYGFNGCWARTINDTVISQLVSMGKPIAKQIYQLLDSTEKCVPAHIILLLIFKDTISSGEKYIVRNEQVHIKETNINGLIWTTEIHADGSLVKRTLNEESRQTIKDIWRKRIQ